MDDSKHATPHGEELNTTSVRHPRYFQSMRVAGAQARRVLLDRRRPRNGCVRSRAYDRTSVVVHKASNRR